MFGIVINSNKDARERIISSKQREKITEDPDFYTQENYSSRLRAPGNLYLETVYAPLFAGKNKRSNIKALHLAF